MIVYPYAVYPILLKMLTLVRTARVHTAEDVPLVTFIISAFNEEDVIAGKIENTLLLDYPIKKREIIVVSDCSTDRTDELVRSYAGKGVALLTMPSRQGKTAGLNEAVRQAKGEILVFSDADSMYETDSLKKMAGCFSGDDRIGLVTGSTNYLSGGEGKMVVTTGIYTRLEQYLKRHETMLGSCVGADGAIFGMRKALYQPLQNDDINDLALPLKVVRQGEGSSGAKGPKLPMTELV